MFAIIRLRGSVGVSPDIEYTLKLLRLHKVNHCVVVEENDYTKSMLQKVKDYVAWGEISEDMLVSLFETRGRLVGGLRLTDQYVREMSAFGSIKELAGAMLKGDLKPKQLMDYQIKPVFRLHPPRKGHKGIKRPMVKGGALSYHGSHINELLLKMR